jgi:ABC-type sugar transport system ATPase subunit
VSLGCSTAADAEQGRGEADTAGAGSAVAASHVSKRFGATCALDDVSFEVLSGEIHALVGENGAGKSTLVRILGGVHRPDAGEVLLEGRPCHFANPREAIAAGIVTIPQELRLVGALSVAENVALGDLPVRHIFGILPAVDRARMRAEALKLLQQLDFNPDPDARVDRLNHAERQLVAIAKGLRRKSRVFILDEPTAALESREIERLFAVLRRMKAHGTAIVYVSHRLDEVVALADRCTVLRDGRVVWVSRRGAFSVADLVQAMTGRLADHGEGNRPPAVGEVVIEDTDEHADCFRVRAGEVVGLAGLIGSGAERVVQRLFGAAGKPHVVRVKNEPRRIASPAAAIAAGIGMVPGERQLGLVMNQSVRDNILLPNLDWLSRGGHVDNAAADRLVAELMELLDVRPRRPELAVSALSGGNQQKVILAKWLARNVAVLLLDEPTHGIDVGAKAQIHALIRDYAQRGGGVLINSSDLAELARLCDAVLAMRHGRIAACMERGSLDESRLRTAIGG